MAIKKRHPRSSKYVFSDGGMLVVRTPAECSRWPVALRKHLISGYIPPSTTVHSLAAFHKQTEGDLDFRIAGRNIRIVYRYGEINAYEVLVHGVYVLAGSDALLLNHPDAAMRVLMAYAFLHDEAIGGLPKLTIVSAEQCG